MATGTLRVGGARLTMEIDDQPYQAGINRTVAGNVRLQTSAAGINKAYSGVSRTLSQFSNSIRSSLVATAAYAVGVNAVRAAVGGSVSTLIDWDEQLIRVRKTTGIYGDELEDLGEKLRRLQTVGDAEFAPIPIDTSELLDIAEAAGQIGQRTVGSILDLTKASAALAVSSNLTGREAATILGRIGRITDAGEGAFKRYASAITALGNSIVGNEAEVGSFVSEVTRRLAGVGGLADELLFTLGATFVEFGARAESAATAVQRIVNRINEASSGNAQFIREIGDIAGASEDSINRIIQALQSGDDTEQIQARGDALLLLLEGLGRLARSSGDPSVLTSSQFFSDLTEGGNNVRIISNIGLLGERLGRLREIHDTVVSSFESGNAHIVESNAAAESYGSTLKAVSADFDRIRAKAAEGFVERFIGRDSAEGVNTFRRALGVLVAGAGGVAVALGTRLPAALKFLGGAFVGLTGPAGLAAGILAGIAIQTYNLIPQVRALAEAYGLLTPELGLAGLSSKRLESDLQISREGLGETAAEIVNLTRQVRNLSGLDQHLRRSGLVPLPIRQLEAAKERREGYYAEIQAIEDVLRARGKEEEEEAAPQPEAPTAADPIIRRPVELDLRLPVTAPQDAARRFSEDFIRSLESDLANQRIDLANIGLDSAEAQKAFDIARGLAELSEREIHVARELEDTQKRRTAIAVQLERARAAGTEEQIASSEKLLGNADAQLAARQSAYDFTVRDNAALAERVRHTAEELASLREQEGIRRREQVTPDLQAAAEGADEFFRGLLETERSLERQLGVRQSIAGLTKEEAAGLQATVDVTHQYADALERAEAAITRAARQARYGPE